MRLRCLVLAALPFMANADDAPMMPDRVLSGVDGNQVHISLSQSRGTDRFVSVCLHVPAAHRRGKGIAIASRAAEFVAPDSMSCLQVAPMAQRVVLLTRSETSLPMRSMAFMADLTGLSGYRLDIDWRVEVLR